MNINTKYLGSLSKVFSNSSLTEIAETGRNPKIKFILKKSGFVNNLDSGASLAQVFDTVYSYLTKYYKNEYIFKNAITNKILLGRHSLNTTSLLSEFRAGKSKIDVLILNGTSTAYEIKSKFDNFDRIESQMDSYRKLFDEIYLVTDPCLENKISHKIDRDIGIIFLTSKYTFRVHRKAVSNRHKINQAEIFNSLRKDEQCKIILNEYGELPDVPNTLRFRTLKNLFTGLSPIEAHQRMVKVLFDRGSKNIEKAFVDSMPHSLKLHSVALKLNSNQKHKLIEQLKRPYIQ